MRVPQHRFRCQDFYGDTDWHCFNELYNDFPLGINNPLVFRVGDSHIHEKIYGLCTKIKSDWMWEYGLGNMYSSYTDSSTGTRSHGSTYYNSMGVGISQGTWYTIAEGNTVQEAYLTTGSSGTTITRLNQIYFYYYYSINWSPEVTTVSSAANRGIIVRFRSAYSADLPSAMYSIDSENNVTWDTSNPIYRLLYGREVTPYS